MELEGRTAVVTGGGSGIGRGISLALAAEQMNVAVADIELDAAERVRDEITAAGGRAIAVRVDATDRAALTSLADATVAEFGQVNLLSNNVGVPIFRRLEEATEDDWGWAFEFNIMAMVRAVNVFIPYLRQATGGAHIVNTASTAGLVVVTTPEHGWGAGQPVGVYTATKHAVVGYTETLRDELGREGIGVSALCPGGVPTNHRFTSARNRPARFGGPFDAGERHATALSGLTADDVGRIVARGVKANRALILTHQEWAADVTRRYEATMADFAFFATPESGS